MSLHSQERDARQRSLGFISFSVIAHVSLLVGLMFMRLNHKTGAGSEGGHASRHGQALAAKAPRAARPALRLATQNAAVAKSEPSEILLADTGDAAAVEWLKTPATLPTTPPAVKAVVPAAEDGQIVARRRHKRKRMYAAQAPKKPKAKTAAKTAVAAVPAPQAVAPIAQEPAPEELSPVIADETVSPIEALPAQNLDAAAEQAPLPSEPAGAPMDAGDGQVSGPMTGAASNGETAPTEIEDASLRQPLSGNPLPAYPPRDRLLGHQGLAVVTGKVDANGHVSNVEMEKSSGSSSLDQASMEAFKKWQFAQGPEATVRKSFAFSLNGEAQIARAQLGSR